MQVNLLHQISLIPDVVEDDDGIVRNLKEELLEVIPRVITAAKTMQMNYYKKDLEFLFDIYNLFISPKHNPQKTTCNNCRLKVIHFFTAYETTKKANT